MEESRQQPCSRAEGPSLMWPSVRGQTMNRFAGHKAQAEPLLQPLRHLKLSTSHTPAGQKNRCEQLRVITSDKWQTSCFINGWAKGHRRLSFLQNTAFLFNCFDVFFFFFFNQRDSLLEQGSPPPSLVPLYLAEISVTLQESESDLSPKLMDHRGGRRVGPSTEGESRNCCSWEGEVGPHWLGLGWPGRRGHSVLVDEAASRFPM